MICLSKTLQINRTFRHLFRFFYQGFISLLIIRIFSLYEFSTKYTGNVNRSIFIVLSTLIRGIKMKNDTIPQATLKLFSLKVFSFISEKILFRNKQTAPNKSHSYITAGSLWYNKVSCEFRSSYLYSIIILKAE